MPTSVATTPKVSKRDGSLVDFDKSKIEYGIKRSAAETGHDINGKFENLIESIINEAAITADNGVIATDVITGIVKRKLMDYQYHEVAEAFILFSDRQAKLRIEPNTEMMADYVTMTRYSRFKPELNRREIFPEIVDRVEQMHIDRYPSITKELEWAFNKVRAKQVLPSMRSMQFGGPAMEANNAKGYNCSFSIINRARAFSEAFWLLLSGTGVGFSVQFQHIDQLEPVKFIDKKNVIHHIVPDTIEGWADAAHELIRSYLRTGVYVEFAYNKIRPQGALLKTSGGRAPGHLPLKSSLNNVRKVLENAQGRQLKPIECYDIMCMLANAVYAGGIREAAMICLFSLDDGEMMNSKTGNWYSTHPWRARANNSVVLHRKDIKKRQFCRIFKATEQWGEPGFYFTDDEDTGANPCVTGDTWVSTDDGLKQVCDLLDVPFKAVVDGKKFKSNGFFPTGSKQVLRVEMKSGRHIDITANHKVMTNNGWQSVGNLMVGDNIKLHDHSSHSASNQYSDEKEWGKGLVLGWFIGDGNIVKRARGNSAQIKFWGDDKYQDRVFANDILQKSGLNSENHPNYSREKFSKAIIANPYVQSESKKLYNLAVSYHLFRDLNLKGGGKHISDQLLKSSKSLLRGFLTGYFDADGTVTIASKGRYSIRLCSNQLDNLKKVQLILSYFGIKSNIAKERHAERRIPMPNGHGGYKKVICAATHDLIISGKSIKRFASQVGFSNAQKAKKLEEIKDNNFWSDNIYDTIKSIDHIGIHPVYDCTVPGPSAFDANGLYVHNCVEIGMNPKLTITPELKMSLSKWAASTNRKLPNLKVNATHWGWQMCNLTEVNVSDVDNEQELYERVKAAAIIGTAQAGYTDFKYLGWVSEAVCNKEALLGVSMTGVMDNPDIALNPEIQRNAAQVAVETNIDIANRIGINTAARVTCIKPSGSASIVLGAVGSGIHTHHAEKYFRRVRANPDCPVYKHFKNKNPHMCISVDARKDLITFPIKAPENAITRHDLTAIEFLEKVLMTQRNWVIPGTAKPNSSPGVTHNVSNTITVKQDEWDDVKEFLWRHRKFFSGVSMLPDTGDKEYVNAPREEVKTESDKTIWQNLINNSQSIDWTKFREEDDNTTLRSEKACAGGACLIE